MTLYISYTFCVPKNRRKDVIAFTLRIPRKLKKSLEDLAEQERRSLNEEMIWLLERALERRSER